MNTEKLKTLEQIHIAIEIVESARANPDLNRKQKYDLEMTSVQLWSLEQSIIRKSGEELITSLTADSIALNELADKIKESSISLSVVAESVEKAAKIVESLIKIIISVEGAGLI